MGNGIEIPLFILLFVFLTGIIHKISIIQYRMEKIQSILRRIEKRGG